MPLLLLTLLGCNGAETSDAPCDTGIYICDTAAYWERENAEATPDPTSGTWIEQVRMPSCFDAVWVYDARIRGTSNGASVVNAWATVSAGGLNEEHPLTRSDVDADGERLTANLLPATGPEPIRPGETTSYQCGVHDVDAVMTYAVRVYDQGGTLADCAIWSAEPNAAQAIADVLAGARPEPRTVTARDELAGCQTWAIPP